MPTWVLANAQKRKIIEGGRTFLNTLILRIYKTSVALSGTVMPTHPTHEATDTGYAPMTNPFPNVAVTDGTRGKLVGITPSLVWDHDSGDWSIHGLYCTDPADSNVVVMAAAEPVPFLVEAPGQVYVINAAFFFDTLD